MRNKHIIYLNRTELVQALVAGLKMDLPEWASDYAARNPDLIEISVTPHQDASICIDVDSEGEK